MTALSIPQTAYKCADAADDLTLTGRWLEGLALNLGRLPRAQRRQLLRALADFRRDLAAIKLDRPEATR